MSAQADLDARQARAEARRGRMTIEVVQLGTPKPAPYAASSPEERLEAAKRLIEWQQELRGRAPILPRSEWPGEAFTCGGE